MSSTPSIQIFGCVGSTADLIAQSLTQPAAPAPVLQAAPAPWPVLGLKHTIYDPVTDIRSCTSDFTADIPVARTRGLLPPQLEAEYQIERFCCYQKDYEPWHSVRVASGQTFEAYVGHLRQDPNQKVFIKHCNPGSNIQVQQEVEQILKYPDHHNNGGKPLAWTPAPVSLGVLGEGCETDYPQHWQLTAGKTWRQFTDEAMFAVYNYYPGGELSDFIDDRTKCPAGEDRARELMVPIIECIFELHRAGIAHRDLKPQNIMVNEYLEVDENGNSFMKEEFMMIDLGLARVTAA